MSKNLFDDPKFQAAVKEGSSRHEIMIIVGNAIKKDYPKPLETFGSCPRENIIDALVATCSTEEEIRKTLKDFGFGEGMTIDIMEPPTTEADKEGVALIMAMGGTLTKDGLPCIIMEYDFL